MMAHSGPRCTQRRIADACSRHPDVALSFVPNADCPQFKAFLNQIFADDQSVSSFVQRAVGYSLGGYASEQCFLLLVGKGSNGKSTFLNTLQNVFGDYAATTPAQTLMVDRYGNQQTNDLAKLVGIRFVAATETEKGQRLAESKIKRMRPAATASPVGNSTATSSSTSRNLSSGWRPMIRPNFQEDSSALRARTKSADAAARSSLHKSAGYTTGRRA